MYLDKNVNDLSILHLTLKKKWFDMIEDGEKIEEYREIKPFWISRLIQFPFNKTDKDVGAIMSSLKYFPDNEYFKHYDVVKFKNGYQKNAPEMTFFIKEITVGSGVKKWGAVSGTIYFVIRLGIRI